MEEQEQGKGGKGINRREFFIGAAGFASVAVMGASQLAACAPKDQASQADNTTASTGTSGSVDWLGSAPEIADADISEYLETDVVIAGAGVAGCTAGFAATENGASVILLEKGDKARRGGGVHAAVNTKIQASNGIHFSPEDIDAIVKREIMFTNMHAEESLMRVWANESGAILDKIIALVDKSGIESRLNTFPVAVYDQEAEEYFCEGRWPLGHAVGPGDENSPEIDALTNAITNAGGTFLFSTPAVKLMQDASGAVTGIYGQKDDGTYVQVTAKKGVIVTTGEYANNPAMVDEFCPYLTGLNMPSFYTPPNNTGDGHKMMMWAGAVMQRAPHAPMMANLFPIPQPAPFLLVNNKGERFENEANSNFVSFNAVGHQPGLEAFQIFDSTWADEANSLKVMTWQNLYVVDDTTKKSVEDQCETADTLEELADKLGIPKDTFVATVNRRNQLADNGHDDDFGVPLNRLRATKVAVPPFYGCKNQLMGVGVILGGVWVNTKLQVLNDKGDPIPGLYAAGNTAGRRFGASYQQEICGLSNGLADCHGYVAGRTAATS